LSIRYAIDAYVAKAVEAVDDDDLSCAGEDAAKVARILSDVAVNLATLDAQEPTPVFIDEDGYVWAHDGGEWDIIDYLGDELHDPKCGYPEGDGRYPDCSCNDELAASEYVCDDPDCDCHDEAACCDECGADLGFTDDDVIVTLRVGDNGYAVNVEGPICETHADSLRADVFDLAHKHFGDDEDSLVDRAASDVVIRIDGPVL
jgi:hypothetical protein